MTTGEHVWQIANGDGPRQADPIKHLDLPPLGTKVLNFPISTETLLFTAMGQKTEKIRFLVNVLKLPVRNPLLVAKLCGTTTFLTDDRLSLGCGLS